MGKAVCIIPARGGSKRIPGKNIKEFLGKPIIAYSIEVAINSGIFDLVMVSTDDEKIAEVARSYGAAVPFMRSEQNADDYATTTAVIEEVLGELEKRNQYFEQVCVLYPTAPFVKKDKLLEAAKKVDAHGAVIPVTAFNYPVWRSFSKKDDQLTYRWPEFEKSRSQDLEMLYHDAGQWYFINKKDFKGSLVPPDTAAVVLSGLEVQDIDSLEDWKLAELKYEYLQGTT